jgi:hypothetical protein
MKPQEFDMVAINAITQSWYTASVLRAAGH